MISRENLIRLLNQKKAEYSNSNYKQIRRGICKAINIAHDMPTVDAVQVVRCRDCKHRGIVSECPMCYTDCSYDGEYSYEYWDVDKTVDDGFCHCGEEMDAEVEG